MSLCTDLNGQRITFHVIYRPPPSQTNALSSKMFHKDFADFLESAVPEPTKLCILGDINFHWEIQSRETLEFSQILSKFELVNHIEQPTHNHGHTLEFIITRADDDLLSSCCVQDQISDHNSIHGYIRIKNQSHLKKSYSIGNSKPLI